MSNYNSLKTTIDANIKQNGRQEITGQILNSVLNQMVTSLGAGYQFMGVAMPDTNPGTPDPKEYYLAITAGTYTNFGGIVNGNDEISILMFDSVWTKINTGIAKSEYVTPIGYSKTNPANLITGKYRVVDGSIGTLGDWNYTEPIKLLPGDIIYCKNIVSTTNVAVITQTTESGTYIKVLQVGKNGQNDYYFMADSEIYVSLSFVVDDKQNIYVVSEFMSRSLMGQIISRINSIIIRTGNVEDGAITLEKLNTQHVPGTNMIDRWNEHGYINANGEVTPYYNEAFWYTNFIPVNPQTQYYWGNLWPGYYAFYDENKALIEGHDNDASLSKPFTTPQNAKFARFTTSGTITNTWLNTTNTGYNAPEFIIHGLTVYSAQNVEENNISPVLSNGVFEYINKEKRMLGITNTFVPNADITGKYRNIIGNISELSDWGYTNPIKVKRGDVIIANNIELTSIVAWLTEVNENGDFIKVLVSGKDGLSDYYYFIQDDCYISITSLLEDFSKECILSSKFTEGIIALSGEYSKEIGTNLMKLTDNPLEHIIRDMGYGSIIHKWGIIGDSLSSGEMDIYVDGVHNRYVDYYEYSWGQRFAKMISAECYNFSNGGQTTYGWLRGGLDLVHNETYEGGTGGGGWSYAKLPENHKQGYIIALGVNDKSQSYPVGSTTTDIGVYNSQTDTDTNANSMVGYYAGIIQRVKSIQPMAKIFCVTPLGAGYAEISQAIRDIVKYYNDIYAGDIYLIDLDKYYPISWAGQYLLNSHGSAMGYQYCAYAINTYIDWIIRNNGEEFKKAALIGLDNV